MSKFWVITSVAIAYQFKVFIPSLKRRVSFKEITIRDLININKSIINNDFEETVDCFDLIIESCCIERGLSFTLIDKILILLVIRAYSVSVFCSLKIHDKTENQDFEHTLELNDVINRIVNLPIEHKRVYTINEIDVEYGVPLQPLRDTDIIHVIDFIHNIKHNGNNIVDFKSSKEELQEVVDSLDYEVTSAIKTYANDIKEVFCSHPIYEITSPFDRSRNIVTQIMSIDFSLYELLKMLFTENLHNLYRSIYNFNQDLKIAPEYVEQLVPVEKDLLWGYYQKDQRDAEASKALGTKTSSFQP